MSYRFLLYLAIVMLVNGRVLNVAANSNAIQQSPKLHLEVKLVSQFYCKDKEGDKISLRNYLETQSSRKTLLLWSCGFCTK